MGDGRCIHENGAANRPAAGARPSLLVHVSSYEQNRAGTATQVSEHTRAYPGQGGGKGLPPPWPG